MGGLWRIIGGSLEDVCRILRGSWETVEGSREEKGRLLDDLRRSYREVQGNKGKTL